ncbi:G-patch domain and KOW motifs-containing protein [Leptinotarsa decemlineata]|uniref:G-patch domain and KOW motifs-containing protein n=1 Tax=Leptinotarsa decemlineata TaxID=7539 RepID=UPI003D30B259
MEPGKKISFGFNKSIKKVPIIVSEPTEKKDVEFIECLEDQSIKIKNAVEVVDEPLVIPMKENKRRDGIRNVNESRDKKESEDSRPNSELTLDELAARELINDAKRRRSEGTPENKVNVLPLNDDVLSLEGEKESTLDDYENTPVSDFGLAMLRGMGWKEGMGIGRRAVNIKAVDAPEPRPKGLGLGANKLVKSELSAESNSGREKSLILHQGAFAKIIAGSHKANYCEVQGFDDQDGKVIVRTSLKGEILTLNEFLVVPVTKEEYLKYSRLLNKTKYDEYVNKEESKVNRGIAVEPSGHYSKKYDDRDSEIKKERKYEASSSSSSHYSKKYDHQESKIKKEIKCESQSSNSRKRHKSSRDHNNRR